MQLQSILTHQRRRNRFFISLRGYIVIAVLIPIVLCHYLCLWKQLDWFIILIGRRQCGCVVLKRHYLIRRLLITLLSASCLTEVLRKLRYRLINGLPLSNSDFIVFLGRGTI